MRSWVAVALILIASAVDAHLGSTITPLDGDDWQLKNANGTVSIPATVPGVVTLDMIRAGLIGDPYYRFNEIDPLYRDIVYSQWTYTKQFDIDGSILNYAQTDIVFEGLDTAASITLNGHSVGTVNNMFRRWTFDVSNYLVQTGNVLVVAFENPIDFGLSLKNNYPYTVSISDPTENLPYRNFVRKVQSDYGWDWGPAFAPTGIYRGVRLVSFNSAYITDVTFLQSYPNAPSLATVNVNVTAYLRFVTNTGGNAPAPPLFEGVLNVTVGGLAGTLSLNSEQSVVYDGTAPYSVLLTVQNPLLWYPVGYGDPALYVLTVGWLCATNGDSDGWVQNVGFRFAELVRESMPVQQGISFYFRINGIPVFAKGANFIPMDAFHPRVGITNFTQLLVDAVDANINIVRVWGGGLYQQREMYELADTMGVLIWQEFAFACAMYPRDTAFLNNVRAEVHYQTRRLISHPSVIIFGGNNENEAALGWYPEPLANRDLYIIDYVKLYIDTVRDAFLVVSNYNTEFVSSSPSNGPDNSGTTSDPYVQMWGNPQDIRYGDVHFYDYADDCSDVSIYPRARFISEFGFQSHTSFIGYGPVTESDDWSVDSPLFQFRQRHPDGNAQLLAQMKRHFIVPNATNTGQQFDDYLYITQAVQSICYRTALRYWRSIKQETPGNTMGIIYWQLNDIWQAPTWASMEYGGRWKMVHYHVKRSFAPIIMASYVSANNFKVYVVSDYQTAIPGPVTLTVNLYDWSSPNLVHAFTFPMANGIAPLSSTVVVSQSLQSLTAPYCTDLTTCFFVLTLTGEADLTPHDHFYLSPISQAALPIAHVAITNVTSVASNAAIVTLQSDNWAPYTWLETASIAGKFDDNGFLMPANVSVTVRFVGNAPFDVNELASTLKVRSIVDTYTRDRCVRPPSIKTFVPARAIDVTPL